MNKCSPTGCAKVKPLSNVPPHTVPPPPSDAEIARSLDRLAPMRRFIAPAFLHTERIPKTRPLLFVGNHTTYGLLDTPFLYDHLYRQHGIFLRALGDHAHFSIPVWRDIVTRWGVVDGTRANCRHLMASGASVLVFPGGAREAAKRRGERYKLIWANRLGFVRMAIAHGCTIVPFAALGAEDALDIVADAHDIMDSPLGRWVEGLGLRRDLVPPLVRGIGPTPIPRPERLYFWFGEPVSTAEHVGSQDDDALCLEVRGQVHASVDAGLDALKQHRSQDPKRSWVPRLGDFLRGMGTE